MKDSSKDLVSLRTYIQIHCTLEMGSVYLREMGDKTETSGTVKRIEFYLIFFNCHGVVWFGQSFWTDLLLKHIS